MHGVFVDHKGNVWLGGNGAKDSQILKFTEDGKFLMQSGHQGKNAGSNDPENFGRVAQIYIDPKTNEGYVADGYKQPARRGDRCRHRQDQALVGRLRQQARRRPAGPVQSGRDALQQYRNPVHCVALANDGLLYVCDRQERPRAGLPHRRQVREGAVLRQEHAGVGLDLGDRVLQGSGSSASST